ncbi:sodium:proton antiporter [Campylobacter sp. faydin G-24]|uniref:Sodium:proton antiporter n=1 Tax=Campylobacter anatolicus TaxID=2829105 RepID=A0ABS5HFQ2_9BACT|nr:sodium:proton antiporter [Campylobacter anatolicus]MBR8462478.1 sodium:proton antiporter [Campylobacter anatolicus]MBR8463090.1 sodium:proton antiporter [Campylobacter anatolicus]MBR8465588.1 sodium:proton antiporter [Campylobacter anatolicus]
MLQSSVYKFKDQLDAATKMLEILPKKELVEAKTIVVCMSLDSVIMTDEICKGLGLSYEMLFSEPIAAPNNNECDIAIVSETEDIVVNDELTKAFDITYDFIYGEAHRKYEEKILKNVYKFRKGNLLRSLKGSNVLLMDEGCETGLTALVCIKTLSKLKVKTISYATPIIATDVATSLSDLVDEIYTVEKVADFIDVDTYYNKKIEANSECIISILEDSPYYLPLQKQQGEKTNAI